MEIYPLSPEITLILTLLGIIVFTTILYFLIKISDKISIMTAEKASKEFVNSQEKINEEFNLIFSKKIGDISKKLDKIEKFYFNKSNLSKLKPEAITKNTTSLAEIRDLCAKILEINEKTDDNQILYLDELKSKSEIKKCIEDRERNYASQLVILKELEIVNSKLLEMEETLLDTKEGES
jgi:hypothetical protein